MQAERLVQEGKQNAAYLRWLGNAKCGLGMVRRDREKETGWEEAIRSGLIHIQKAAEIDTKSADYLNEVGSWRKYLAEQLKADGLKDEALAEYRLALNAYRKAKALSPKDDEAAKAIRELSQLGIE